MYKLVIPTAGIGSRIGPYTKFKNKALVSVGLKPAIIKVMENFDDASEIIILTGYEAETLKDVILAFYPDKNIRFIHVDNYSGEGSGLGHTLNQAREYLQCPFIFSPNDAIFHSFDFDSFKENGNKMCYYIKEESDGYKSEQYRTISYESKYVSQIYSKGVGSCNIYTGLCKIDDYHAFWNAMDNPVAITAGEVVGLAALNKLEAIQATHWLDCGTIETLAKTKKYYDDSDIHILEKEDEAIWFAGNTVIKFSKSADFIKGRVRRYEALPSTLTPRIKRSSKYTYCYEKIKGSVYDPFKYPDKLVHILDTMQQKVWTDFDKQTQPEILDSVCDSFYCIKTKERASMYFHKYETFDKPLLINKVNVPKLDEALNAVPWLSINKKSIWSNFHGDFHPENIIMSTGSFKIIDWRQNFGNAHDCSGDVYYDLAKFMHGLEVNHGIVSQNLFDVTWSTDSVVNIDIHTKRSLVNARNCYIKWLTNNGYDVDHVKLITALIYINIAPLHEYPYSEFLHLFGRLRLQSFL